MNNKWDLWDNKKKSEEMILFVRFPKNKELFHAILPEPS
jgi:hypothetical protein